MLPAKDIADASETNVKVQVLLNGAASDIATDNSNINFFYTAVDIPRIFSLSPVSANPVLKTTIIING